MSSADAIYLVFAAGAAVLLVVVVRARRRSFQYEQSRLADREVCEHLRCVVELLQSRGHAVRRVGQRHPDLPLEIHMAPPFDPSAIFDELKLTDPVSVSQRNVLYCTEDWCEIHPAQ